MKAVVCTALAAALLACGSLHAHEGDSGAKVTNVSKTKPAKLLVFFVTEQNAPLVLPPTPH